jgi:hypothetical protein
MLRVLHQAKAENGLQDAVLPDVRGEFRQLCFVELTTGIGFRFANPIQWNVLNRRCKGCIAVR